MKIHGFDHVEYYLGDLTAAVAALRDGYGFRVAGRSLAASGQHSVLVRQGQIRLLLTEPATDDDRVAAYLSKHGDGIAVIAFATDDVTQAFTELIAAGAEPLASPVFAISGDERVGTALVAGFGDVTHKLVERSDPDGEFAPGFIDMAPGEQDRAADPATMLDVLDHVAICLPSGQLDRTVDFYRSVFGLTQIYDERIEVGTQAMASKVVQDHDSRVTFTLIEPDTTLEPGQIDEFLQAHDGAGVQHLAFRTPDITKAVRTISSRGVEFLVAPAGYYQALEGRLGRLAIGVDELRELNVLADRDRWGQMFQIFARSTHQRRTFFVELIERQGALTFGSRNIRALYEALEDTRTAARPELVTGSDRKAQR
ncbi:MAG TPA: 4-hydroxyphenylpyruvate dioxygenase [Streptosporangiaceae bacterium]|nr:4-hydroxyphenylpyruvate dioxygenase [Streptosporangiaceae bacterium]